MSKQNGETALTIPTKEINVEPSWVQNIKKALEESRNQKLKKGIIPLDVTHSFTIRSLSGEFVIKRVD